MESHPGAALSKPIVLAGHFDPAMIARHLPDKAAARLACIRSSPAVPIHSLASGLISRGIRTTLVGGVRSVKPLYIEGLPLSVAIYTKRGGWPFVMSGLLRERKALLALLEEIKPMITHAHWTLEAGRAVGDWRGPKVLTVHDAAWEYMRLGWSPRPVSIAYGLRWLANTSATIARFRHVIAVSPFVETYLRLKHRFRGEIRVIPNIIPELPSDLHIPEQFPKSGIVTFACYGEPGPLKNVSMALKAFGLLGRQFADARLLVFGKGWDKAKQEFRDNHRIEFRGGIPHADFLRCLAQEVDVWVHPSRIEMHPITICEALMAGCAVVAGYSSGSTAWTLDYGRSGLLVDIDSAEEIAEAMRTLVLNRALAEETIAHARRHIREHFRAERIVDLHLRYYRDICAN